jgi:hypothetical protein
MDSLQFRSGCCAVPSRVLRRLPSHSFNNSVMFTSKLTPITFGLVDIHHRGMNTAVGSRGEVGVSCAGTLIFRGT